MNQRKNRDLGRGFIYPGPRLWLNEKEMKKKTKARGDTHQLNPQNAG